MFAIGTVSTNVTIRVYQDGALEGAEDVVFELVDVTAGVNVTEPATISVVVVDTVAVSPPPPPPAPLPVPTIAFEDATEVFAEPAGGFVDYVVTVVLSGPSASVVTTEVGVVANETSAVEGVDFDIISGPLVFTPGSVRVNVTVRVYQDSVVEADEVVSDGHGMFAMFACW